MRPAIVALFFLVVMIFIVNAESGPQKKRSLGHGEQSRNLRNLMQNRAKNGGNEMFRHKVKAFAAKLMRDHSNSFEDLTDEEWGCFFQCYDAQDPEGCYETCIA